MSDDGVRAYYQQYGEQEWERLTRPTDGVFVNDQPGRFTGGYGVRPAEVAPFFGRHGLEQVALLASEGFAPDLQEGLATLASTNPTAYQAAIDALVRTAAEPSILGLARHLLYVGRKGVG